MAPPNVSRWGPPPQATSEPAELGVAFPLHPLFGGLLQWVEPFPSNRGAIKVAGVCKRGKIHPGEVFKQEAPGLLARLG